MNIENRLLRRPENKPLLIMPKCLPFDKLNQGDVVGCYANGSVEDSYFQVTVNGFDGDVITGRVISVCPIHTDEDVSFSLEYVHDIYSGGGA